MAPKSSTEVEPAMNRAASLLESNWMSYKFSDAQAVMHVFAEFFVRDENLHY